MAAELTYSADERFVVDFHVRRRRFGETAFLIRRNDYVALSAVADTAWLACERGSTVAETIVLVAERHDLPVTNAAVAVLTALEGFRRLGFTMDARI